MKLVSEIACGSIVVPTLGFVAALCLTSFAIGFFYGAEVGARFSRVKRLENRLAQVQNQMWRAREIIRALADIVKTHHILNDASYPARTAADTWLRERH